MKGQSEHNARWTYPAACIDPRAKVVAAAAVGVTAAFSGFARLGALAVLCLVLQALSQVHPATILKRVAPALPLLLFLVITLLAFRRSAQPSAVIVQAGLLGGRTILVLWSFALLSATTSFSDIVRALKNLGLPRLIADILFFASRYESVLLGEAERMRRALASRSAGNRRAFKKPRVFIRLLSRPLERAFDRSARIHAAMLARGYRGKLPALDARRFSSPDISFIVAVAAWIIFTLRLR